MNINTSTCEKREPAMPGLTDPVPGSSSDTGVGEKKKKREQFPPILLFRVRAFSIGQLHDDIILLQLPESFSLLFSCAN